MESAPFVSGPGSRDADRVWGARACGPCRMRQHFPRAMPASSARRVILVGENRFRRTELFLRKKFDVHRKILSIKTPLNEKRRGYGNYFYYNFEHHFPATSFGTFREIFEEILSRIHKDSFFVKLAWTRKERGVIIVLQVEHAACI